MKSNHNELQRIKMRCSQLIDFGKVCCTTYRQSIDSNPRKQPGNPSVLRISRNTINGPVSLSSRKARAITQTLIRKSLNQRNWNWPKNETVELVTYLLWPAIALLTVQLDKRILLLSRQLYFPLKTHEQTNIFALIRHSNTWRPLKYYDYLHFHKISNKNQWKFLTFLDIFEMNCHTRRRWRSSKIRSNTMEIKGHGNRILPAKLSNSNKCCHKSVESLPNKINDLW